MGSGRVGPVFDALRAGFGEAEIFVLAAGGILTLDAKERPPLRRTIALHELGDKCAG
jgi:hypothetical protein